MEQRTFPHSLEHDVSHLCEVSDAGKGSTLHEGLTLVTLRRPLPSTGYPMSNEQGTRSEGSNTFVTLMRFLPVMESLVFTEMGGVMTSLPTLSHS